MGNLNWAVPCAGASDPKIIFVCEPQTQAAEKRNLPMDSAHMRYIATQLQRVGIPKEECRLIGCSPPIPEQDKASEGRKKKFVAQFSEEVIAEVARHSPDYIVPLGAMALHSIGCRFKISKARGYLDITEGEVPRFAMLQPSNVITRPETKPQADTDFDSFAAIVKGQPTAVHRYEWCTDLSPIIANPPKVAALDVETTTAKVHRMKCEDDAFILTVQLSWEEGQGISIPVSSRYQGIISLQQERVIRAQLRELVEDCGIKFTGFNGIGFDGPALKYDLGINIEWAHDAQMLAWMVDENALPAINLADAVKLYVPQMAGYSDEFDRSVDKSRMIDVHPDQMLQYAAGDADATLRLTKVLLRKLAEDRLQKRVYDRVKLPGTKVFAKMSERGIVVDTERLSVLREELPGEIEARRETLMRTIPVACRRKWADKQPTLSTQAFVRDILFGATGFNLTPRVWTKSTEMLEDVHERMPSLSTKDHLPFFVGDQSDAADWIILFTEFKKLEKMLSTYIGPFEEKYVHGDGRMHASFMLHRTNTGRTACLTGDTEVTVLDPRGKVPIRDIQKGDWVWSYDSNLEPVPAQVTWSGLTLRNTELVEVSFLTNGTRKARTVRCTPDHRFRLRDGSYVEACKLGKGDRVLSIETGVNGKGELITDDMITRARMCNRVQDAARILGVNFYRARKMLADDRNHVIAGVRYISRKEDVYDITVEGTHCFIANGVCVHNSADPNNQNFPKRGLYSSAYRTCLRATEGKVFVAGDESQAELRIAAIMANEPTMIRLYREGADIHAATAAATMGMSLEQFNQLDTATRKAMRQRAKAVNFGFLYGMGWNKFKSYARTDYGVQYTDAEAKKARSAFFATYPGLESWHGSMREWVKEECYVRSLHGCKRRLPSVLSSEQGIASMAERQAINAPVQHFASELGVMALIQIDSEVSPDLLAPVGFIHDQVICEAPAERAEEAGAVLRWYMENPPLYEWFKIRSPIPFVSDLEIGPSLGELEEYENIAAMHPAEVNYGY